MVGVQVTEEQLESITDRTVQEADEDGDGAVSFLEFTKVRRQWDQEFLGKKGMGKHNSLEDGRGLGHTERGARTPGEEVRCVGLRFKPLDLTTPISPQSLEKMNIEQKMSIRILK